MAKKLFLICLAAFTLIACSDSSSVEEPDDKPARITLSTTKLSFDEKASTAKIVFYSSHDWNATVDCDWLTIEPKSGSAGNVEFVIKVSAFSSTQFTDSRTATITITAAEATKTIAVKQSYQELVALTLDSSTLKLDSFNSTATVKFNSTHDWTLAYESDWLTVAPTSGRGGDAEIVITAQPHFNAHSFDSRKVKISLTTKDITKTIDVTQEHFVVTLNGMMDPSYRSTDFSQNGVVHTMQTASEGAGINLIFMGDGFTDRLIADGTYGKIMHLAQDALFTMEPFKSFRHYFTCRYVDAVSPDERVAGGHNTALGVQYDPNSAAVDINASTVLDYVQKYVGVTDIDNTLVIVVGNISERRGTCHWMSSGANDKIDGVGFAIAIGLLCDFQNTLIHECAHGFAKLADEYVSYPNETFPGHGELPRGWYLNVDTTNDPAKVKWSHFLSDTRYAADDIGIFEGAWLYGFGAYRPSEDSMMRASYNGYGFNAPSREAIYRRIHQLAFGADWKYDYEAFVKYDAQNIGDSRKTRSVEDFNCVETFVHQPPIVYNHSWREALGK